MRAFWLPDVLREQGCAVYELPGWQGRGRDTWRIDAIVLHDTVTTPPPAWSDARVDALLRDGRPGVPGPLAQSGQDRAGTWRIIASGRSNHNGYGRFGNNALGLETYAAGGLKGHEEPWNSTQIREGVRGVAAVCAYLGLTEKDVYGHKETDPRRKIDPWGVNMNMVRALVRDRLHNKESIVTPEQMNELKAHIDVAVHRASLATTARITGGRNFARDQKVVREGVRGIAAKLGLTTAHKPTDRIDA